MNEISKTYLARARKGIEYLLTFQSADGSFRGSEKSIIGPYKFPQVLAATGYVLEAERTLRYIRENFHKDGEFNAGPEDMRFFANYRNGYLCWGSQTMGAFELAAGGVKYLEAQQNPNNGGIPISSDGKRPEPMLEWACTASSINGFVPTGRLASAIKAGDYLLKILAAQPSPTTGLYLRANWDGSVVTDVKEGDVLAKVDFTRNNQAYWFLGIGMSSLGKLYQATGEQRFLDAAERIFEMTTLCQSDVYAHLMSAKVGWGTSVLYAITKKPRYREVMLKVGDFLLSVQTPEGAFVRLGEFPSLEAQPLPATYDTTSERCYWLVEIAKVLERVGSE